MLLAFQHSNKRRIISSHIVFFNNATGELHLHCVSASILVMFLPDVDISIKDSSHIEYIDFKGRLDIFYKNDDNETVGRVSIDSKSMIYAIKNYLGLNKEL